VGDTASGPACGETRSGKACGSAADSCRASAASERRSRCGQSGISAADAGRESDLCYCAAYYHFGSYSTANCFAGARAAS
jgi:hypothetical protein